MLNIEKYSVWRLLSIQWNHFATKDMFWSCVSWFQIYLLLAYGPDLGRLVIPEMKACMTPDVQNGVVQKLTVQTASGELKKVCKLLPKGHLLTYS